MTLTTGKDAYDYPLLIKQLLATPLAQNAHQEIVSAGSGRYSYTDLAMRIAQLANTLVDLGVKSGDTVAVMDVDCHRYLECFFAVPMIGAVLHTVNIRLSPEQILYTINHAEDDVLLVHQEFLPIIKSISAAITRPYKLVVLGAKHDADIPSNAVGHYELLLGGASGVFEFSDFDERTVATTFYTTGTTGDPKGVAYSHRQLVLHTMGILAGFGPVAGPCGLNKDDVYMPITPMFHVHAWGFPYAATLAGLKQVYPGKYDPVTLLELIADEKVTFSHCVPTILHMLLSQPQIDELDLSHWKVAIGGAAMPQGLALAALERGIQVFSAYGMSETCPLMCFADVPAASDETDANSLNARCIAGKAAPMVELRVVDAQMNDVPADGVTPGEIVARAPWLTQGYTKNQTGSDELWSGGFLHTGDVGVMDSNGSLQITDRIKDVIKSGGEWISSLELENLVSQCAGVSEVAVIGTPDQKWGERPLVLVVPMEDAPTNLLEVIGNAFKSSVESGKLSRWAHPERIEFVDVLPKTSVGKLDKKLLRQRYQV